MGVPETQNGGKYGLLWGVRDPNSFLLNGPIPGDPSAGRPQLTPEQEDYVNRLKDLGLNPKWTYKDTSNENGASGGYELEYDKSKLPKSVLGDRFEVVDHNTAMKNPNLYTYDPNYGYITVPGNTKDTTPFYKNIDIMGPLLVGGFAAGAPAMFGALGASGAGAAATTGGLTASQGMNLANTTMSAIRGAANGNWQQAGQAALSGALGSGLGGGFQIPTEMRDIMNLGQKIYGGAKTGIGLYNMYNQTRNS